VQFREANANEIQNILEEGYKEWPKGRTLEKYIEDNKSEDAYGTRFVLSEGSDIMCSLIQLELKPIKNYKVYGFGSILTSARNRNKGFAKKLILLCLGMMNEEDIVFLYSDIDPHFYEKLGFVKLPRTLQHTEKSICMVKCKVETLAELLRLPLESIPSYF